MANFLVTNDDTYWMYWVHRMHLDFSAFAFCLSAAQALERLQILRNRDVSSVEVACCIDLHIDVGWGWVKKGWRWGKPGTLAPRVPLVLWFAQALTTEETREGINIRVL